MDYVCVVGLILLVLGVVNVFKKVIRTVLILIGIAVVGWYVLQTDMDASVLQLAVPKL